MSISISGASSGYDAWQTQQLNTAESSSTTKLTQEESQYDTNGDGVLSVSERMAMLEALGEDQTDANDKTTDSGASGGKNLNTGSNFDVLV